MMDAAHGLLLHNSLPPPYALLAHRRRPTLNSMSAKKESGSLNDQNNPSSSLESLHCVSLLRGLYAADGRSSWADGLCDTRLRSSIAADVHAGADACRRHAASRTR